MGGGGERAALRKGQAQACREAQLPLFPAFTGLCLLGFAGLGTGHPQRVVLSFCRLTNNSCWQFLSSALYDYRFKLDQCTQKRERPLDGRLARRGAGTLSAFVCAGWGPRAPTLQSTTAAGGWGGGEVGIILPALERGTKTLGQLVTRPRPTCGKRLRQDSHQGCLPTSVFAKVQGPPGSQVGMGLHPLPFTCSSLSLGQPFPDHPHTATPPRS